MKPETAPTISPEVLQGDNHTLAQVLDEIGKVIVGQSHMNRMLLVSMLTGGHVLVEGLPGLAKTLAVKTLAHIIDAKFHRVQFTPDLLPSDLIGTLIYTAQSGEFLPKKGPIFTNILLADEINRAPAKVQSALLEAMAERQVTIGDTTYPLEEPFLVLATQNPIEQEGTYPLPEAQLDRFLFKLKVQYPSRVEEKVILDRGQHQAGPMLQKILTPQRLLEMRSRCEQVYMDERIKEYIVRLVVATRRHGELQASEALSDRIQQIREWIQIGASPRATIFLSQAARSLALLEGRAFVIPDDVKSLVPEVLRHRLILSFEAEARGRRADDVITELLDSMHVP